MPNISIMTPELNSSVIRPTILDIIEQVKQITGIPKNTRVLFSDYLQASYQRGSTMQQQTKDSNDRTSFSFGNQLAIEVESEYNEGNIYSTAVSRHEHIPIFNDDNLGVLIKPIYSKTDFTINITYRSTSPTEGKKWRDAIRMHISNMRDINLHDVSYHYGIPGQFINILKEIHRLRENVDPYGEDLETYLAAHSTTRLTTVSNQSGSKTQLSVAEKQMRILGLYNFEIAPEKGEPDTEGHAWLTTFSYKVSLDIPIALNMRYPIMVHNQLLDEPYITYENQSYDIDKIDKAYPLSLGAFSHFESTALLDRNRDKNKIVRIPDFDEFVPTSKIHGTAPIFSALCSVDEDRRQLLNLNELGDFSIDSEIMDFLREEYSYLSLPYKSIFNVSLYRWSALASDKDIVVDSDLNVKARQNDLSLRVNHRVVFSIVKDLRLLGKQELTRLKKHRNAAIKILKSLDVNRGVLNLIAHQVNFNALLPDAPPAGNDLRQLQMSYFNMNTVQTSIILGMKNTSLEELDKLRAR